MTAEELLQYRNEPYRQELIGGRLYEMEPTGAEHGRVEARVGMLLLHHVERENLGVALVGDVGFQLGSDPDTVRAPDVAFVARERVEIDGVPTGYWVGPPDLAIEVVSPNDWHSAIATKALDWLDAGARAVLVVDPRPRTVTVYRARDDIRVLADEDRLNVDDVVPGWSPRVVTFFA